MQRLELTQTQENTASVDTQAMPNQQTQSSYTPTSANRPTGSTTMNNSKKAVILSSVIAVIAGVITGFGGFKLMARTQPLPAATQPGDVANIKAGDVFGSQDTNAFKDSAEGYLEEGGFEGEGSHKIIRPGGESQTVYITSSVTDLDTLVGMEVKVWGETFKGQKAGWLMDVGRIEVINPDGEKPTEE